MEGFSCGRVGVAYHVLETKTAEQCFWALPLSLRLACQAALKLDMGACFKQHRSRIIFDMDYFHIVRLAKLPSLGPKLPYNVLAFPPLMLFVGQCVVAKKMRKPLISRHLFEKVGSGRTVRLLMRHDETKKY
jgi:hypothetical protein